MKRLSEQRRRRGIVVTFGRFQPPTSGHELVMRKVLSVAKKMGYEHRIYTSPSQNNTKNPLRYKEKVRFLRALFPKANIYEDSRIVNPFFMMKQLSDQGYKDVILIVGSDRVNDMSSQISKYIGHSDKDKSFEFVIKTPPAAVQLLEASKVKKGSGEPNREKVATVSWDQVKKIAEDKMVDLNAFTVNSAMKMVAGTARSMGIKVNGGEPPTE